MHGDGAKIADDELLAVDDEFLTDFLNEAPFTRQCTSKPSRPSAENISGLLLDL